MFRVKNKETLFKVTNKDHKSSKRTFVTFGYWFTKYQICYQSKKITCNHLIPAN